MDVIKKKLTFMYQNSVDRNLLLKSILEYLFVNHFITFVLCHKYLFWKVGTNVIFE